VYLILKVHTATIKTARMMVVNLAAQAAKVPLAITAQAVETAQAVKTVPVVYVRILIKKFATENVLKSVLRT